MSAGRATWSWFSPGAEPLAAMMAPARTALLLVDIQNDFGHADGVMGKAGANLASVDAAVDAAEMLTGAARAAGVPVVHVRLETTADLDSRAAKLRRDRLGLPGGEAQRVCRKATWGAEPYRIAAEPGDLIVTKPRYASFQGTELDLQLRALAVDTLVIGGLTTECCVEAAVRDAFHRDYSVFLAADASTSYNPVEHDVCVGVMARYCALPVRSADVDAAWRSAVPREAAS